MDGGSDIIGNNPSYRIETIAHGYAFPEGPRWHDDSLWFFDHHDGCVRRIEALHVATPARPAVTARRRHHTFPGIHFIDDTARSNK
jgi:sugar lactone lactonase YvrE